MSLSEVDRQLLQRCLDDAPQAWYEFVDRFLGLVVHVANHTAQHRGLNLDVATRDDLVSEVFLTLLRKDRAVLRRFRRNCSLATYLAVIARRVIVRRLHQGQHGRAAGGADAMRAVVDPHRAQWQSLGDADQIQRLMLRLDEQEANVVRLFHLQGKSYRQISHEVGIAENSIGSLLSRARQKMRQPSTGFSGPVPHGSE